MSYFFDPYYEQRNNRPQNGSGSQFEVVGKLNALSRAHNSLVTFSVGYYFGETKLFIKCQSVYDYVNVAGNNSKMHWSCGGTEQLLTVLIENPEIDYSVIGRIDRYVKEQFVDSDSSAAMFYGNLIISFGDLMAFSDDANIDKLKDTFRAIKLMLANVN